MSRRVRVTVEGDATESPANGVLRVYVGASRCVMVDPEWSGVTVEDVEPPRVWTDGDVVQRADATSTYAREDGYWYETGMEGVAYSDDFVTTRADEGALVLRYQAGE